MPDKLKPKLYSLLHEGYSGKQFIRDLTAGVIVGIVALPLAIAFAIASGVKPEQGLYTAVIAGFIIAVFGGSRVQVSGPTGAFIVVIYSIVQQFGYTGLATATFIAGILLILMGLLRFGALLKFVPYPLTVGFTSGIALIIFSSQVKDFLGLNIEKLPAGFIEKWQVIINNISTINYSAFAVSAISLLIIIYFPRITRKVPGSLAAIITATIAVYYLKLPVETIGSRFGAVPNTLPMPEYLKIDFSRVNELFRPAVTIALLGGIESLLSAVVADGMLGTKHRSNMELVAQGIGNMASPFFQGIPATGAIARTATNIKNGARTPIAAIIHCLVLLLIMYFFGKLAVLIPMAALAAILINVAYNMSEWHAFIRSFSYPKSDIAVLLVTFLLTLLADLTVAIEAGVVLSALLFVKRMEETAGVEAISSQIKEDLRTDSIPENARDFSRSEIPEGVEVFEAFGPIFFSAVDRFTNSLARIEKKPKVLILYMAKVNAIDGTGLRAIQSTNERMQRDKCILLIAGAKDQTLSAIKRAAIIPDNNIYSSLKDALNSATSLIKA